MNGMRINLAKVRIAFIAGMLAASLMSSFQAALALDECIGSTNGDMQGDCVFTEVDTATDGRIIVKYWGNQDYDFYQLRWSRPGLEEKQMRVRGSGSEGGWWALDNARVNTPYTFKVQACFSSVLGSECTYWSTKTFQKEAAATKPQPAQHPATCASGYVWRNAFPGDLICVTPKTREQAAYDNSQAAIRRDPNGAWGPYSCISGYVWRVARPEDLVCVTPETRSQTAYDNSQAAARLASTSR